MRKIDREEHQRIIKQFLSEKFVEKNPALRAVGKGHIYQCFNANADDVEARKLLSSLYEGTKSDEEFLELAKKLERVTPTIFCGRNYITADKDRENAIKRLKSLYPSRGSGMFEVNKYQDYFIIWD